MSRELGVIELLERMVAFPSISGSEAEIVAWVADYLDGLGLPVVVSGRNLSVTLPGASDDLGLLFNTHLDVVPPGEGWTSDPFTPVHRNGHLYGRGANDAKGCGAAMIAATLALSKERLLGRVVLALTCDEETGGDGLEKQYPLLPPVTAAVVGEPTFNRPSIGMRGLLSVRLVAQGRGCHASRPHEGVNPIYALARDIVALEALQPSPDDPILGKGTLAVTVIEGGSQTARNRVPDTAEAVIDARTTSSWNSTRAVEQMREAVQHCEVVIRSERIKAKSTLPDEHIAQAAKAASGGDWYAFRGASDFTYVPVPGVILGPGNTTSHQPDEHVPLDSVEAAVGIYADIVRRYFEMRK